MTTGYVHGYSEAEAHRLGDQAETLATLLHAGTSYGPGERVLEVGCGVGAQTVHLVRSSPQALLTSVDISEVSLAHAQARVAAEVPGGVVDWRQGDLFNLPFADASYDHLFVCFVLEHLAEPVRALRGLRRLLRPGGTITVIEGDHGSAFYHPASNAAQATIDCLVRLQAKAGGNGLVGRQVEPLLTAAGYRDVVVRPRTVYADETTPELVRGFTLNTFTAMVSLVREDALAADQIDAATWDLGIADLRRTAEPGGTFHYTFFKGLAAV